MNSYQTTKDLIQRSHSTASFRPQGQQDWSGDFPLPDAIIQYFAEFGPENVLIGGYGNPYFLPSLAQLWSYQTGYRFNGNTNERCIDWDDDWLVIADEGADPFIFSRANATISHAFHGEGFWQPTEIFQSLQEMAAVLAIVGDIVASAGPSLTDDDSLILDCYIQQALTRITQCTGSYERAQIILSMLAWSQHS